MSALSNTLKAPILQGEIGVRRHLRTSRGVRDPGGRPIDRAVVSHCEMKAPVGAGEPVGTDRTQASGRFPPKASLGYNAWHTRVPVQASSGRRADPMAKFIGEILVERGLASRDQIEQALHLQSQSTPHKRLGQILIDQGILSQNQIRLPSSERESLLLRLIARINSTLNTESLLATIMQASEDVMGAQASSLFLIDRETGDLLVAVPTGAVRAEILGRRIPAGLGLCGWVASHGEPLVVHEARKDPRFFGDIDEKFQTIDVIAVPLRNPGGNVIGVLEVGGTVIGFAASTRYHS